jgi:hypothetical protein
MEQMKIATPSEILAAFHAARPLSGGTLDSLCHLHKSLEAEARTKVSLGWCPVGGETLKANHVLTPKKLQNFAGHTFGGIGFEALHDFMLEPGAVEQAVPLDLTDEALERYKTQSEVWAGAKIGQLRELAPQFENHWMALIQGASACGGPSVTLAGDAATPFPITHHGIRVGYRAPSLAAWMNRPISRLMEIGGGHGRFIRDAAVLFPDAKLILTDLPFNLIVSARYLIEYFGHEVNLCVSASQSFDPDRRINIIAPWRLNEISVPVDTACNFLSFQHMDGANLTWYGDAMRNLNVQSLFQVNRDITRDPFDKPLHDYPFATEFEVDREQVFETVSMRDNDTPNLVTKAGQIIQLAHRRN